MILTKGAMAASHIPEANTLKDLYDKLLDLCVTDKLTNGIPIGLLTRLPGSPVASSSLSMSRR